GVAVVLQVGWQAEVSGDDVHYRDVIPARQVRWPQQPAGAGVERAAAGDPGGAQRRITCFLPDALTEFKQPADALLRTVLDQRGNLGLADDLARRTDDAGGELGATDVEGQHGLVALSRHAGRSFRHQVRPVPA